MSSGQTHGSRIANSLGSLPGGPRTAARSDAGSYPQSNATAAQGRATTPTSCLQARNSASGVIV